MPAESEPSVELERRVVQRSQDGTHDKLEYEMKDGDAQRILVSDEQIAVVEGERNAEEIIDENGHETVDEVLELGHLETFGPNVGHVGGVSVPELESSHFAWFSSSLMSEHRFWRSQKRAFKKKKKKSPTADVMIPLSLCSLFLFGEGLMLFKLRFQVDANLLDH